MKLSVWRKFFSAEKASPGTVDVGVLSRTPLEKTVFSWTERTINLVFDFRKSAKSFSETATECSSKMEFGEGTPWTSRIPHVIVE